MEKKLCSKHRDLNIQLTNRLKDQKQPQNIAIKLLLLSEFRGVAQRDRRANCRV